MQKLSGITDPKILSDISRDAAQVFFAAVLIEPIVSHSASTISLVAGGIFSLSLWFISIRLNRAKNL